MTPEISLISSLSSGYEEMQAQFAWDDMAIRQTFIRKVQKTNKQSKEIC